ncbi:SusE domain-containing protein [Hwangdonia seohaensis]|uniref:SusE domain-containing protein n=1 Tax=Hwangdonia seohaensis TaxID=1240727 RepID=A0ABW3RFU2_9FLAO|nr:SusE domain-containing protein [Hwangdonia seohaensis]
MNLYIKKISFLLLSFAFLFTACETEESLTITTPEAKFVLNTPGISTVFLNFALPDNPAFTISWNDEVTGGGTYNVEMSTDEAFTAPVTLGTTDSSNFSMTVADFNNAIASAGVSTFKDVAIYMRVSAGSQLSNNILLLVTTYPVNAPEINNVNNGDAFVLSLDNNDVTALTVEWDDPILYSSLNQDVSYVLEGATAGTDFAMPIEAGNVTNHNAIALTNAQLNALAIQSGIAVDATGNVDLRVRATITDSASGSVLERISSTVTISVTTYLTVLDLSTNWGVVGAVTGWGGSPDLPFWTTDVDGVLVAYVTLPTGEIKFRENMDWANNYGDNDADGTLDDGGANINITTAGSYKITMDLNNLTYTIESFSLGIVGGAYNEWGATPDFMLEYDQYSDVFRGIVTLIDGEMKFRMNNDWGTNWGDDGVDGTLEEGGANIVVAAGIYIATVNMNDLTYTLEPIDYVWGLVGGAYNEWGATPDAQFTRDWSRPFNDIWILNDVTLIDGEYKFRANNDWGVNYGDDGGDGVLEAGGANLVTTAGTYSFVLDFSDPANPTYTKN